MDNFIKNVAQYIAKKELQMEEVILVVPGKRIGVFLKKEFAKILPLPSALPKIVSIQDWLAEKSDQTVVHPLRLQALLFESYKEIKIEEKEHFGSFIKWANTLLADFNEMEKSMADVSALLNHLQDFSEIDAWSEQLGIEAFHKNSLLKQKHEEFWKIAHQLHHIFHQKLEKRAWTYSGKQLRTIAESIREKAQENTPIYFIGFNALSKAEEQIFDFYIRHKKAQILWDIDHDMLQDIHQETGMFIRKYWEQWREFIPKDFPWKKSYFRAGKQQMKVIPANGIYQQMEVCSHQLNKWKEAGEIQHKTAHVLCDEKALFPFLSRLPDGISSVNITMGFPLSASPTMQFIKSILALVKTKKGSYYLPTIETLFSHPFFSHFDTKQIFLEVKKQNRWWSGAAFWNDLLEKNQLNVLQLFFQRIESNEDLLKLGFQAIELVKKNPQIKTLEKEFLYEFFLIWDQMAVIVEEFSSLINDFNTFQLLVEKVVSQQQIDFVGDPIGGLQIMGMLETRLLDYDRIVFSNINEGVMPKGKSQDSFIPYELKKHYGLTTHIENDAVYAYHFFRLLQRVKEVVFVYNSNVDTTGGSQVSRFVMQLIQEWKHHPHLSAEIQEHHFSFKKFPKTLEVEYARDQFSQEQLISWAKKGISASWINSYFYSSLAFYRNYVLGIRDEEENENIAINELGTVIHNSLERLYNQNIGVPLSEEILKSYLKQSSTFLREEFEKLGNGVYLDQAQNRLQIQVAKRFVDRVIYTDLEVVQQGNELLIIANEMKLEIEKKFEKIPFPVKLKGYIDRVDQLNGEVRLLDYKTGKVEQLTTKKIFETFWGNPKKHAKTLQVLFYLVLYGSQNSNNSQVSVGIWFIRSMEKQPLSSSLPYATSLERMEELLGNILYEIFFSEEHFQDLGE
ncbi:MAG: PD-(D/E)XK nuclease family protein [Flavobacteriales bacterium]|jgi:hypothetical protein|nr:PD-(D/E)XK nuclease family protein [Flavobacteriales bacterium]